MTKIVKSSVTTKNAKSSIMTRVASAQAANRVIFSQPTNRVTKYLSSYKTVNSKIGGGGALDTSRFRYNQNPVETPDGIIVAFTLPSSEAFVTGLIEVFVNGNQKIKATEWQETGTTQITFIGSLSTTPPTSDEVISLNYIKTG